jgi:carbamoyl-phosphate synthase large subunit
MASTGEVACLGNDFEEAFLKARWPWATAPVRNILLSTGPSTARPRSSKREAADGPQREPLRNERDADFLAAAGIATTVLHWPLEDPIADVLECARDGRIDRGQHSQSNHETELTNDYLIRRRAVDRDPLMTNLQLAQRFAEALSRKQLSDLQIELERLHINRKPGQATASSITGDPAASAGVLAGKGLPAFIESPIDPSFACL